MANNVTAVSPSLPPATSEPIPIVDGDDTIPIIHRHQFPPDFVFGVGASAVQVEGAGDEGGKGKSIWDTFCEKKAALTNDQGWLAIKKGSDQYHHFERDARILKDIGVTSYRFSISWPRIMPNGTPGKAHEGINLEGVAYYNNLINALKARGIEPFVTLFHWDLPQTLEDKYGGFLSDKIRDDFKNYADFCFKEFGDRVKHWSTLNEPYQFSWSGYATGSSAPGHGQAQTKTKSNTTKLAHRNAIGVANKSFPNIESSIRENPPQQAQLQISNSTGGVIPQTYKSSAIEPYKVGHNLLLAHAAAYNLYKTKYKHTQGGECGITLNCHWFQARDMNSSADKDAAKRAFDFMLGWFMEPLTTGQYPTIMKDYVQDRLPSFTEDESKLLTNSFDYIGMNYYTAYEVKDAQTLADEPPDFVNDPRTKTYPLGLLTTSQWIYIYPQGLQKLLREFKKRYGDQKGIYVTENGIDEQGDDPHKQLGDYLSDGARIKFHRNHLYYIAQAIIRDNVNVKGYFAWSFLDSFEFTNGNRRFGFCFVDYDNGFKRMLKSSGTWYKIFLENGLHPTPIKPDEITNVDQLEEINDEVNQAGTKRKGIANTQQRDSKRQNNNDVGN